MSKYACKPRAIEAASRHRSLAGAPGGAEAVGVGDRARRPPVWPWFVAVAAPIVGGLVLIASFLVPAATVADGLGQGAAAAFERAKESNLSWGTDEPLPLYRIAASDPDVREDVIEHLIESMAVDDPFDRGQGARMILDEVCPDWERSATARRKVADLRNRIRIGAGKQAAEVLEYIGDRRAIGSLLVALDKDYDGAYRAWHTFRRTNPDWYRSAEAKKEAPFLRAVLGRKSTSWCKLAAVAVLEEMRDKEAVGPLLKSYFDYSMSDSSSRLLRALTKIDPDWHRSEAARAAAVRCVDLLANQPEDADRGQYEAAILGLGYFGDVSAVPTIIEFMLTERGRRNKEECLRTLYRIDPDWRQLPAARKAAVKIAALLKSPKNYMRERTLAMLKILANPATFDAILDCFLSPDWEEAFQVGYVLEELDRDWQRSEAVKSRIPWLIENLTSKSKQLRRCIVDLLGETGDGRVIDPLLKALGDEDWGIRSAAASSLGKLCDGPTANLILLRAHKDGRVRSAADDALRNISDQWYNSDEAKAAVPELTKLLADPDINVRLAVVDALLAIGTQAAADGLKKATSDKDERVRDQAKEALRLLQN